VSIREAVKTIVQAEGKIDVVVNNAGFGAFGPFELSTDAQRRELFDVNVFGVMNVVQAVLPVLRKNQPGSLIQVSSIGGLMSFPLFSTYHSSKWAIEGFSESLYFELLPLGIQVKIIEPGATKSAFNGISLRSSPDAALSVYQAYVSRLLLKKDQSFEAGLAPEKVAKVIFKAATDHSHQLRYVVGNRRSLTLAKLRRILPTEWFLRLIKCNFN
jgi:short-subunit dehydrogenase